MECPDTDKQRWDSKSETCFELVFVEVKKYIKSSLFEINFSQYVENYCNRPDLHIKVKIDDKVEGVDFKAKFIVVPRINTKLYLEMTFFSDIVHKNMRIEFNDNHNTMRDLKLTLNKWEHSIYLENFLICDLSYSVYDYDLKRCV